MEYSVRPLADSETAYLDDFLYEAIFIPEGVEPPHRDIIKLPELQVYVEGFGTRDADIAYVAEVSGRIVGAVWVRIMDDYGHIDDTVPSLAISLYKEFRSCGIGTALMSAMLGQLKARGYGKVSLSVQKQNYAVRLYRKFGFVTISENDEEYIMVCDLRKVAL